MAQRLVKGPDGTVQKFPGDATDAEISAALQAIPEANKPQAPAARTWTDFALDTLPAVGGLIGGAAGLELGPGAVATAGVGAAAGQTVKNFVNAYRGKKVPTTLPAAVADVGLAGMTYGATPEMGGMVAGGLLKAGAPWLMQKAVKPTEALLKEYKTTAPRLVKTLLDEGINVTQGGLDKLQRLFDATNADIRAAIQSSTGTIDKGKVAQRTVDTAKKLSQQVNPTADLQAVDDVVLEFFDHPTQRGPSLKVQDAQDMKVGTYQQIGKKYGQVSSANLEAQKALARGLKDEIALEVPEISGLNARDAKLMAAMDAVGRRAALSGNKDPVGFAWVAHNPVTFLAAIFDRSPVVKSLIARGAYQAAGMTAKVSPQLIRVAVVALAQGENGDGPPGALPDSSTSPASR